MSTKTTHCWVYMTAPDRAVAERIGAELVTRRLAACVNVLDGMTSIYRWQGRVEKATECVCVAKTRAACIDQLKQTMEALHPYECPCVLVLPILDGHVPFLEWITEETNVI